MICHALPLSGVTSGALRKNSYAVCKANWRVLSTLFTIAVNLDLASIVGFAYNADKRPADSTDKIQRRA
jgi:hypothetical protein